MDGLNLLHNLNDKQREAVAAKNGNMLVLAGAGSGKTRVLVYRIAWLVSVEKQHSIMAVTFTNKASREMRYRIEQLTTQGDMWIGTFHGLAHRLLRIHYAEANLPQDFQIIDSDDQIRLLKKIINGLSLDETKWSPRQAIWYIGEKKDAGLRPKSIDHTLTLSPLEKTWIRIYQAYQEVCDRAGLVDFSELLLRAHELCLNKQSILDFYRNRFSTILVDECQDTNKIQYEWIRLIAGKKGNVMMVGDDDQSIYSWRGAKLENIYRFIKDFTNVRIIRLEQNYRSTQNILRAANSLIIHNGKRLHKNLWTDEKEGEKIDFYSAVNELDEAGFVANCIKISHKEGRALSDFAILYRSNAQSRVLEEALLKIGVPYRVYGGMRFFERQEIKDALSYLRLIANRNDDAAYDRVINMPARGIGNRTLNLIHQIARDRKITLWKSSILLLRSHVLSFRAALAVQRFIELVDRLSQDISGLPLHIQTDKIVKQSGLWALYEKKQDEKNRTRLENLKELVTATRQFHDKEEDPCCLTPLQSFLSYVFLEEKEENRSSVRRGDQDVVHLMTMHASKGLEFQQVFMVGMEEGMFPIALDDSNVSRLEEERRLAYVGITRAMRKLTITFAETRRLYGKVVYHKPSRFIRELTVHQEASNVLRYSCLRTMKKYN